MKSLKKGGAFLTCLAVSLLAAGCSDGSQTITDLETPPSSDLTVDPTSLWPVGEELATSVQSGASAAASVSALASANVLIFGDRFEKSALASVLTGLGHTVTNVTTLPLSLSPFQTIWHVGAFAPLTAAERTRLAAFLAAGGGVHLTGERPCCEAMNASHETLINSVVAGGGITLGGLGDFLPQPRGPGVFTFNPGAVGAITTTPNTLVSWSPAAPGGMAGLAASNILVTHNATGTPNGAVWECSDLNGGDGQLTILMDVNWLSLSWSPASLRDPAIDNIQTFLERDCVSIEKEKIEGPDQVGVALPAATTYVFEINYTGPAAQIQDAVPAEFEVTNLSASSGTATFSTKNSGKSATHITWDVPAGSHTLTVTMQTRESPGKRNSKVEQPPVFKPTSCGPLPINNGATAFEVDANGNLVLVEVVDPDTGEVTLEPVVIVGPSNSLGVEAVEGAKSCEE